MKPYVPSVVLPLNLLSLLVLDLCVIFGRDFSELSSLASFIIYISNYNVLSKQ
jgi:hypothetical protein